MLNFCRFFKSSRVKPTFRHASDKIAAAHRIGSEIYRRTAFKVAGGSQLGLLTVIFRLFGYFNYHRP